MVCRSEPAMLQGNGHFSGLDVQLLKVAGGFDQPFQQLRKTVAIEPRKGILYSRSHLNESFSIFHSRFPSKKEGTCLSHRQADALVTLTARRN